MSTFSSAFDIALTVAPVRRPAIIEVVTAITIPSTIRPTTIRSILPRIETEVLTVVDMIDSGVRSLPAPALYADSSAATTTGDANPAGCGTRPVPAGRAAAGELCAALSC